MTRISIIPNPAGVPSPVLSANAQGISQINLFATWSMRSDVLNYRIDFAPTANGPWSTLIVQSPPPNANGSLTAAHNGLAAGTTLFYRALVTYRSGRQSNFCTPISASTSGSLLGSAQSLSSASAILTSQGVTGGAHIKWVGHTGHWMNNNHPVSKGEAIAGLAASPVNSEIADLIPGIVGYKLSIAWSALDPNADGNVAASPGYAFIKAVKAKMNSMGNYKLFILPEAGAFTQTHPGGGDDSLIPLPIQQNVSLYGQAGYSVGGVVTNPPGVSGWGGGDTNGNTYGAALHNANVMTKYIATMTALGALLDSDPQVTGLDFRENSLYIGALSTRGLSTGYSNAAWDTQARRYVLAMLTAWPTSNLVYQNTFMQGGGGPPTGETTGQNFTNFMLANRVNQGGADLVGATAGNLKNWGGDAYMGVLVANSTAVVTDHRSTSRTMIESEGPDYNRYSLADLLAGAQNVSQCAIVWWSRVLGGAPTNCLWPNLKLFLTDPANALIHQGYPANYP